MIRQPTDLFFIVSVVFEKHLSRNKGKTNKVAERQNFKHAKRLHPPHTCLSRCVISQFGLVPQSTGSTRTHPVEEVRSPQTPQEVEVETVMTGTLRFSPTSGLVTLLFNLKPTRPDLSQCSGLCQRYS